LGPGGIKVRTIKRKRWIEQESTADEMVEEILQDPNLKRAAEIKELFEMKLSLEKK
jgi:hypothetical protein